MVDPITRDLPADALTEIAIDFTRPVYLVKMLFPLNSRHVSTGPQISFDGDNYLEGQVSVSAFSWDADGTQQGKITLSNELNAAAALVLGATVNDIGIEIYQTYLISGGGNTAPQLYVNGVMDGAKIEPAQATIDVVSTTAQAAFLPNRYHTTAEGFNWLPVEGEVITWGDEVFVMKGLR